MTFISLDYQGGAVPCILRGDSPGHLCFALSLSFPGSEGMSGGLSPSLTPNRGFAPKAELLPWVGWSSPHILSTGPASPSLPLTSLSHIPHLGQHSLGGRCSPVGQQSLPEFRTNLQSSFFSGYEGHPAGHHSHSGLAPVRVNPF